MKLIEFCFFFCLRFILFLVFMVVCVLYWGWFKQEFKKNNKDLFPSKKFFYQIPNKQQKNLTIKTLFSCSSLLLIGRENYHPPENTLYHSWENICFNFRSLNFVWRPHAPFFVHSSLWRNIFSHLHIIIKL